MNNAPRLKRARESAYGAGEFVGQEGFMRASEIRGLARHAGIAPGTSVLDLCCGVGGPGRFITQEFGCRYLGVDRSARAVDVARKRAGELACRFVVGRIPPVPAGPFDVVLLLETMLAFRDKAALLEAIAGVLEPGGRFAFSFEEGPPLCEAEREQMPAADTVWLTPLGEMLSLLERAGLAVAWQQDCTAAHAAVAESLADAYAAGGSREELVRAHRLWGRWLQAGRARKFALVAEKA